MQSQVVCGGCRTILLYPSGASNVRCALCNTVTPVQSSATGFEMDQIICGRCRTLLMYSRGAQSVRCLCCQTLNLTSSAPVPAPAPAPVTTQVATVRCGSCQMTLMYPDGAPSVKCAVCQHITNVGTVNGRLSGSIRRQNGVATPSASSSSTVVVQNPMSFDGSGKLVSNVVVGVTTARK